jgi:hypothetical protein
VGEANPKPVINQASNSRASGLGYRPSLRSGWSQQLEAPHSTTLNAAHPKRVTPRMKRYTYSRGWVPRQTPGCGLAGACAFLT